MKRFILLSLPLALVVGLTSGCSTAPKTETARSNLTEESATTLRQLYAADPDLEAFVKDGYGYALFPSVGKGGLIAGGAYGRGVVFEEGEFIGYSDLSQATVGAQVGGQTYSELIVFEHKSDLDRFSSGKIAFSANASAVALKSGAAKTARYTDGVAIFTKPIGGLMAEASIGGQQFTYQAK